MRFSKRKNKLGSFFKYLLILLAFFVILAGLFLIISNLFSIKKISVDKQKAFCVDDEEIINKSNLVGRNLLFTSLAEVENLKKQYSCIKRVDFKKSYPSSVNLVLEGREPFAEIITLEKEATNSAQVLIEATASANISDYGFIVDEEGIVFDKRTDLGLRKIYIPGIKIAVGGDVSTYKIIEIKKIIEEINKFGVNAERIIFLGKVNLFFDSQPNIFLNLENELSFQLASLQLILNEAKMNENVIEFIDLRFDKPIVKFRPKKK